MTYRIFFIALAFLFALSANAQHSPKINKLPASYVTFAGIVSDSVSGLPLAQAAVLITDDMMKTVIAETSTDETGRFELSVPKLARYAIQADKATFFEKTVIVSPDQADETKVSLQLLRKPGYVFDITIFDKAFEHNPVNTIRDCKVEIYNNTTKEQELTVERLPKSTFNFSFAEGNHYTVLVRKKGFFNRRVEVYVNVNGCILCVDGMGVKEPEVVPIMAHNNEIGHFLGNIELDTIEVGKRFQLKNLYYDFDKSNIRQDASKVLDKLAVFLKDNPGVSIELGSHTDARGSDDYNLSLSDRRAASAVEYLVTSHGLDVEKITSKGYGETQLVNRCDDGFSCSEDEHQLNRRTEIKVTGYSNEDPLWEKSLKQIIEDPQLYRKVIDQEKRRKSLTSKAK